MGAVKRETDLVMLHFGTGQSRETSHSFSKVSFWKIIMDRVIMLNAGVRGMVKLVQCLGEGTSQIRQDARAEPDEPYIFRQTHSLFSGSNFSGF